MEAFVQFVGIMVLSLGSAAAFAGIVFGIYGLIRMSRDIKHICEWIDAPEDDNAD